MKRLLIGGSPSKMFHLREFAQTLGELGIECRVVLDTDVSDGFPSRKIGRWFQSRAKFNDLVKECKPDAIFVDRQRHFGVAATKTDIPLITHLRGNFWKEVEMARQTLYSSPPKRLALSAWEKMAAQCFEGSSLILPICRHLEDITRQKYPTKNVATLYQGISASNWYHTEGMSLKHPCVGLLQSANIFEKTKEMLTLERAIKTLPHVTFYWAGDGPYRDYVLDRLKKYGNFTWLGNLEYPNKVREYLSEIDIYALISGIDMAPLTLLEAQLMEKPVIATSVGGIPELMEDGKTGFLVRPADADGLAERLACMFEDKSGQDLMGKTGRQFAKERFSWERIAKDFVDSVKRYSVF